MHVPASMLSVHASVALPGMEETMLRHIDIVYTYMISVYTDQMVTKLNIIEVSMFISKQNNQCMTIHKYL